MWCNFAVARFSSFTGTRLEDDYIGLTVLTTRLRFGMKYLLLRDCWEA